MVQKRCTLIELPKITDPRGNLTFIEGKLHIPFNIARAYWIYDVPGGEVRGGHAYHTLQEVIVALSGSFEVTVDDGCGFKQIFHLNRSYIGLYVPCMIWRQLSHFSTNSVAIILASLPFSRKDYIYDYDYFVRMNDEKRKNS